MAPIPEETFLLCIFYMSSICLPQSRLSSIVTPSDLAEETWLNGKSLIASIGETVIVLNFCPDAINMNSVLVIFEEVCLL